MIDKHLSLEMGCLDDFSECESSVQDMMDQCFLETYEATKATPESEAFCLSMGKPFFQCDWYASPGQCAARFGSYRGSVLERAATQCQEVSCDRLEDCIGDWVWYYES